MQWLSPRDLDCSGVRLFCLPHAGSGAAGFYRWKRLLPSTVAVCPVLLPGREARLAEPPLRDASAIVGALTRAAEGMSDRPYAVFGHSMGALLAFEWVCRLIHAERKPPLCLFVSGRNAPHIPPGHTQLHTLGDDAFIAELAGRYGGGPEQLLQDPEMREVFLPILRADLQVVETYPYSGISNLSCPVYASAGVRDASVSPGGLTRWRDATQEHFEQRRFPGDHFYHFGEGQAEILAFIASALERHSSEAQSSSPAAG